SLTGDLAAARRAGAARRAKVSRRTRKAYRITDRGDQMFTELLLADDASADDEKAFALRLAFCGHVPHADPLQLLQRPRVVRAARRERARRAAADRGSRADRGGRPVSPARDRSARALVEHRTKSTQRDLEWVEELIAAERAAGDDESPPAPPPVAPQPSIGSP